MSCTICLNSYDHSLHKPYSLSCPHTLCYMCVNRLNEMNCPICKQPITHKHPNIAVLEMIPESVYDRTKNDLIKAINLLNETNDRLNKTVELKRQQASDRVKLLKDSINSESDRLVDILREEQKRLISFADQLVETVNEKLEEFEENRDVGREEKFSIESELLSESQLNELSHKFEIKKEKLSKKIAEIHSFEIDLRLIKRNEKLTNQESDLIGVFDCSDKMVNIFSIYNYN
jgi:hypothetical protein